MPADAPVTTGVAVASPTCTTVPWSAPAFAAVSPSGPGWVHEIKHDGYRLIARRDGEAVRLFTRRGYDWTDRYPSIAVAAGKLRAARSRFTRAGKRAMGTTARTALLLPLAALTGFARLMGYHPQEWYDARTACRQEMNQRVPQAESPEIRGAYVDQCMKDRGFPN
jgi:hypothetical protein